MAFHYLARNALEGAVVSAPAAPGHRAEWLIDGMVSRPWKAAAPALIHTIDFTLPGDAVADFAAIFDLRSDAGIYEIQVFSKTSPTAKTIRGGLTLDSRGNAWRTFLSASAPIWGIEISLYSPGIVSLGEVVMGQHVSVGAHYRSWQRDDRYATVVNGDHRSKVGRSQMHLSLEWPPQRSAGDAEIREMVRAVDGAARPLVLVPDMDALEVFHGYLTDEHPVSMEPDRLYQGHKIDFTESRRPLAVG